MKKIIVALLSLVAIVSCAPVESSFSFNGTFLYTLRAEFGVTGLEIGSPDAQKGKFKVDSILLDYVLRANLGGTRTFAVAGSTPTELNNRLYQLIEKSFDSLASQVELLDIDELIKPCQQYSGGVARLVYEVTPFTSNVAVIRDTIVEAQRINFHPTILSRWVASVDGQTYVEYVFGPNNSVVVVSSDEEQSASYQMDPLTGVLTVAAVANLPQHNLTFKSEKGKPCFLSSMNDIIYLLAN